MPPVSEAIPATWMNTDRDDITFLLILPESFFIWIPLRVRDVFVVSIAQAEQDAYCLELTGYIRVNKNHSGRSAD